MSKQQKELFCDNVNSIITALQNINYLCEKSVFVADEIADGYPMQESLDEMIINFMAWRDCISK